MGLNRDGSARFKVNQAVLIRGRDGAGKLGVVNEYDEDGARVSVYVPGEGDFSVEVERLTFIRAEPLSGPKWVEFRNMWRQMLLL